jgi:hypothetical protein
MGDAEERLERVKRYLNDELELCNEQMARAKELKDKDRFICWQSRYDVLYGVAICLYN